MYHRKIAIDKYGKYKQSFYRLSTLFTEEKTDRPNKKFRYNLRRKKKNGKSNWNKILEIKRAKEKFLTRKRRKRSIDDAGFATFVVLVYASKRNAFSNSADEEISCDKHHTRIEEIYRTRNADDASMKTSSCRLCCNDY